MRKISRSRAYFEASITSSAAGLAVSSTTTRGRSSVTSAKAGALTKPWRVAWRSAWPVRVWPPGDWSASTALRKPPRFLLNFPTWTSSRVSAPNTARPTLLGLSEPMTVWRKRFRKDLKRRKPSKVSEEEPSKRKSKSTEQSKDKAGAEGRREAKVSSQSVSPVLIGEWTDRSEGLLHSQEDKRSESHPGLLRHMSPRSDTAGSRRDLEVKTKGRILNEIRQNDRELEIKGANRNLTWTDGSMADSLVFHVNPVVAKNTIKTLRFHCVSEEKKPDLSILKGL